MQQNKGKGARPAPRVAPDKFNNLNINLIQIILCG